ncbi:hypothetical protein IFT84_20510 [Rhizobium sp. CFBP 8762]|uniref:hypothetical protein n=1 Tax=Rhizobium sp. CFBP 8762 TaxID=2775279 RepID=UPI00177A91E6|nr:hypothetical protein [Rhizobium sp. CFBP 8762]MBD8556895.1 hypothetical protein [Rhizobium sp. CFBP 8762]
MEIAVSKGEFAAMIGVSPGRISQYLSEGKISTSALSGSGRNAKIIVDRAKQDLRITLDVSQRLGNGIDTRLDDERPLPGSAPLFSQHNPPPPSSQDDHMPRGIDYQIKQQKLEQARRANRNAAIEDAQARGQLTNTDEMRNGMARVASAMMEIFEGGLTDMSMAIAAEWKLPQRDVKHLMRREFRKVRETAEKQMTLKAIALPDVVQTVLEAEEPEGDIQ